MSAQESDCIIPQGAAKLLKDSSLHWRLKAFCVLLQVRLFDVSDAHKVHVSDKQGT